jgi:DeoR/GlpR family transcriptional regulator of sugar metabolism
MMKLVETYFQEERHKQILKIISEDGRVTVKQLADAFNTSLVTIRKDLKHLENEGKLIRTHGGAISREELSSHVAFEVRATKNKVCKERIGRAAAAMVKPGDIIFIDASTTTVEICPHLNGMKDLTVITNSVDVAYIVSRYEGVNVIVLGGSIRKASMSIIDMQIRQTFSDWMIDKAFLGGWGFTVEDGLTDQPGVLITQKRTIVEHSAFKVAMVDYTKVGKGAMDTFAAPSDLDVIITNTELHPEYKERMIRTGVRCIFC